MMALLGPGVAVAQDGASSVPLSPGDAEPGPPDPIQPDFRAVVFEDSDLETTTKKLIEDRWQVDGERLVVEWGAYSGEEPDLSSEVTLMGSGSGGYWVARFKRRSGEAASVRVRAGLLTSRSVAARRLPRGQVLSVEDMTPSTRIVWGAPRPSGLVPSEGWIVQRVMAPGELLRSPAVRPPMAVVSGSVVEVIWKRGPVGLRLPGTAAGSAMMGDTVFVRTGSGQRLQGVAVAPGTVNVTWGGTK